MDARFKTAPVEPAIKAGSWVTKAATDKAAAFDGEELQREILAQLYVANHYAEVRIKNQGSIKAHLTFYTVLLCISTAIGLIAFFDSVS